MVREDDKVREAEEEVREAGDVYPLSPPLIAVVLSVVISQLHEDKYDYHEICR